MTVSSTSVTSPAPGSNLLSGLCRLSIRAPEKSFDLAVPTDIQLVDLLPAIVSYAGIDLDESALKYGGWVLQRLGEAPLSSAGTAESHNLHDGDVVYLRPQRDAMPAVHFDDLVHGVMSSLSNRADSWRPEMSRRLLLGVMLFTLAVGIGVLLTPGPHLVRAGVAAATGIVLVIVALSVSRALGDPGIATMLAAGAIGYLTLTACLVPVGHGTGQLHARLLAGGMAALAGAGLGYAAVGASAPFFLGSGAAGFVVWIGGTLYGATAEHTAAIVAIVVVLLSAFVPGWAFWLSGLRLPPLPANADQLQEGIDPHPSEHVLARTALADGYLTGLLAGFGLVYTGCLVMLVTGADGWPDLALAASLSVLGILHGRTIGGAWQRLSVVLPGIVGLALLTGHYVVENPITNRMLVVAVLLAISIGLAFAARTIPGRRMVPHWARAAEVFHTLSAVTLLPLLLLAMGFYHHVRGLGG